MVNNLNEGLYNPPLDSFLHEEGLGRNLCYVRLLFVRSVGDYNLLLDGDETLNRDNGADRFLNTAQRWLDLRTKHPNLIRRYTQDLGIGERLIQSHLLMRPDKVLLRNEEGTWDITKYRVDWPEYERRGLQTINGRVSYWSLVSHLEAPRLFSPPPGTREASAPILGDHFQKILVVGPPTDVGVTVEIEGAYFTPALLRCEDVSLWTQLYPNLLVDVAKYFYERIYGNTARQRALLEAIEEELNTIDNEAVMQELGGEAELTMEWEQWL